MIEFTKISDAYYFAYGSNMAVQRLAERVPSAEKICVVSLKGYFLKFHKVSNDGSGKCDVVPSGNREDKLYGILFKVKREELEKLDTFERGYERKTITVVSEAGDTIDDVETYIAVAAKTNPNLLPYSWYKEHVLRGAKTSGLPATYISKIEAVTCNEDPDRLRHAREMAIYS